ATCAVAFPPLPHGFVVDMLVGDFPVAFSPSRRSRGSGPMFFFHLFLVCRRSSLETEPALARRARKRLDAAVVEVTAAIEHDLLDALRRCALGEPFADCLCRLDIGAGLEGAAHVLLQPPGSCQP